MTSMPFFKKFSRYLLIGLSAMVLLAGGQQMISGDALRKGPDAVLAEEDNCLDPDSFGCPEPGGVGEGAPTPVQPAPVVQPVPAAPAPPPPTCTEVRQYNECISCNTSRRISQDSCGNFKRLVESQPDAGCASWCPAPAPAPVPPPPPAPAAVCNFSGCGSNGCAADQRFVTGNKCWTDFNQWFKGDGCYHDNSCAPAAPPVSTPAPSCPYGSTQARWQQNTSDPWGSSKTINLGQSANAGSFHDNTGQFAGDTTLTITGPGANTTVGNGGSFTPSQAGAFTLKVTTNSKSGGGCTDSATLTVNTSACTPNGSCSAAAPACGTTTTGIDNCGNSCSKQGAACAVTPPAGGPTNNTNNNTNNNTQNNNQNQTVNVTQSPAVTVSGAVPQVAGVTVTTLPKTGLPALAWSALAFIPAGFRMRRFNKVKKDLEDDPNYIWEDRKFKAGA